MTPTNVPPDPGRTLFAIDKGESRAVGGTDDGARGRSLTRVEATSDVRRFRGMALATVIGAAAAGVAFFVWPPAGGLSSPGPLARPHVRAKLECGSCHVERPSSARGGLGAGASAQCASCHGPHPSTRAAHARLADRGSLVCSTCHAIHRTEQGVTFAPGAAPVRYGPGIETTGPEVGFSAPARPTTVPIVALASCSGCHDVASGRDPIARCLLPGQEALGDDRPIACFDEHQPALPPDFPVAGRAPTRTGVCSGQHTTDRPLAWEAARSVAAAMPVLDRPYGRGRPWAWIGSGLAAAALALSFVRIVDAAVARRRSRSKSTPQLGLLRPAARVRLPQIDVTTCLGCYACVDACPYDVLEVERYVALVARPEACCGLSLCEQRCPNGSLKVTDGEPIGDRPRIDDHLQSLDVPGLYMAGDVSGLPLIKNAIAQGAHAVTRIAEDLRRSPQPATAEHPLDLLVIGAGPAGISAALRARELGLRFEVIEQASVAQSIRSFPRGKLIFDQPLELPVSGKLWLKQATKEELLAQWLRIVRQERLPIAQDTRMTGLERDESFEGFVVTSEPREGGPSTARRARRVLLAVGQRGSPRRLAFDLAPEIESKVHYHLADARSFEGRRILVVGLGDVAMEAAIALARQPGTEARVAYRGAGFRRGKSRNIDEIRRLVEARRLTIHWESEVDDVGPGDVRLRTPTGPLVLPNDAVLVMIGSVPPWSLLRRVGIRSTAEEAPREAGFPRQVDAPAGTS